MKIKDFFEFWDNLEENLGVALGLDEVKQKQVKNKKFSDQKKALRIPTAPKGFSFKDKSKYSRKEKHKKVFDNKIIEMD